MGFLAMDWDFKVTLHVSLIILLLSLFSVFAGLHRGLDAREPPEATHKIPLIGHLMAMRRKGPEYFGLLQQEAGSDIYTMRMLTRKLYLVCSPEWVTAVHKAHKTITFNELIVDSMEKVFCLDKPAMQVMRRNSNGQDGDRGGLTIEIHDMTAASLARGNDLEDMTRAVLHREASRVNQLACHGKTDTIKLWHWVRNNLTQASTTAIYGPRNPYTVSPDLIYDFWQFDADFIPLTILPLPGIFNRKGIRARSRLFSAFTDYIEHDGQTQAQPWIQKRIQLARSHGLSNKMTAHFEVSNNIAILSNTIPTAFWLLAFIFSDASLLSSIRAEIDKCISPSSPNTISDHALKTTCPLFLSTFRETLRYVTRLNSARIIIADTVLTHPSTGETYLLKKGSMVQIMTDLIHLSPQIYGPDAHQFNPRRFMHTTSPDPAAPYRDRETGKTRPAAFRSLGSGNAICLGRHFAQSEIMGLVALFVAGFEIEMEAGGQFEAPPMSRGMPILGGVLRPEYDVVVEVRRREGFEDADWKFEI